MGRKERGNRRRRYLRNGEKVEIGLSRSRTSVGVGCQASLCQFAPATTSPFPWVIESAEAEAASGMREIFPMLGCGEDVFHFGRLVE